MDAQNAVEVTSSKPAASPRRPGPEPDQSKPAVSEPSTASKSSPAPKDSKSGPATSQAQDDDGGVDGQSEAETIVLPGKDGHSPSKTRKVIKHEDKGEPEINADPSGGRKQSGASKEGDQVEKGEKGGARDGPPTEGASAVVVKKKRLHEKARSKDGSSGLSSAPASPSSHRRRRSSNAQSDSDSDSVHAKSPKSKDKPRPLNKLVPFKRKATKAESDDEGESRKARRQRTSVTGVEVGHPNRLGKEQRPSSSKPNNDAPQLSRTRSVSPQPRGHRRSTSTQLPSQSNGLSQKKKRIPAPLQSTDYHSDESSASGSPRVRSSKLRSLTTPATTESTVSPAKMAPHKKHLDAHGQTLLARACARGEYDHAKQRLGERPEDLNFADFAGNTPLQIASINGYENIVKLLIDAGCNLECVNHDKDTPLLDAVDNGHIVVVKLLLEAGVNPRKANVNGEEPIDRVNDDTDNAAEIRAALQDAKKRMGERRFTSEEQTHEPEDGRLSHGPDSPRRSPVTTGSHAAASGRRAGTVRSTKTSNHLLYMPMDDKTLRQAAGRGDEETVTRILQVRDTFDDPDSMVAAARGGHDIVMQLLLALGNANPDPAPVPSMQKELATPMLAAIGQENIKVIRLLLDQNSFDPTRRFQGETYHEIARRRQGTNWKEEEHMLKEAYDNHKKAHKDSAKTRSPAKREQDKRVGRAEAKDESARAHKRKPSSPSRDSKKSGSVKPGTSPREKRRANSFTTVHVEDQTSPKRGPGRPRKEDRVPAIAISDREASPSTIKHAAKPKRNEFDLAAISSEGEAIKPRRKLVSGRDLKGEREKQRRASMVSTASSMKEPSSPRDSRHDDGPERQKTEKHLDRTKQLKRDDSRDRLSVSGESSGKRHRSSETPPRHISSEKDGGEAPLKRRRLDPDGKEKRQKVGSSPDQHPKSGLSRGAVPKSSQKERNDEDRRASAKQKKREASSDRGRRESGKSTVSEKSIHVKSEDMDIEMPDVDQAEEEAEAEAHAQREQEEEKKKKLEAELQLQEAKKKEEEQKRREEDEKRKREDEAKRKEEEEKQRKEEEEREKEKERKRKEEEERKRKEEEEKKRREEEEKRHREEEERKRKEEEERRQREEEERLRREQLEREAAEEARRKREEEERKEQERKERLQREEMERRRAAREAERAAREAEQERIRLLKLPPLLRWLDKCANPKTPDTAEKFSMMQGVRYDCIRPEATGTPDGREQWLLNTQVALLLGEKDLQLSRYTAWERIPVSMIAKRIIWRLESDRYALTTPALYGIGRQLPDYYCGQDPETMSYRVPEKLRGEAWDRFSSMEMFFVKASELMYIVPTIPHLRNLKLTVAYRELPENEAQLMKWTPTQKWKNDPDANRFYGFAPRNKYYVNGELVREDRPGLAAVSSVPFPEKRVPRRGLSAVPPDDPEYARLCREQGLDTLIAESPSPSLPNGVHSSPLSSIMARSDANGEAPPIRTPHPTLNGDPGLEDSSFASSIAVQPKPLVNGVNGTNRSDGA